MCMYKVHPHYNFYQFYMAFKLQEKNSWFATCIRMYSLKFHSLRKLNIIDHSVRSWQFHCFGSIFNKSKGEYIATRGTYLSLWIRVFLMLYHTALCSWSTLVQQWAAGRTIPHQNAAFQCFCNHYKISEIHIPVFVFDLRLKSGNSVLLGTSAKVIAEF